MVAQHIVPVLSRDRNLIGNSPGHDARMVIILHNQLPHLEKRIVLSIWHMRGYIRDLRPHNHSLAVAQIIKILVVLVMRQPDRIRTDFPNQLHILLHLLAGNRVADPLPVLVPGYPAQRIRHAV